MARRGLLWASILLLLLFAFPGPALCRERKRDPANGKIRILYYGDAFAGPSPYPIYAGDPLTSIVPIMASGFHHSSVLIRRHMRLYMPRTEVRMYTDYDMIVISDAYTGSFERRYFDWFHRGVVEKGMGLVMIGGLETFGATGNYPGSWGDTSVGDVLPVECLPEMWESNPGRLEVSEGDNAFIRSLPFEQIGPFGVFYGCNIVGERQGVAPLAYYKVLSTGERHPLLVFWEVGNGASYAMTADWTPAGGTDFLRWGHYADYALNVAIYVTGGRIPDDPELVYQARRMLQDYRSQRQTLDSLVEFASKFGANMAPAERILGEAEVLRDLAVRSYMDGEMQNAIDQTSDALDQLLSASEKAYKLRDEAMMWVFVTEWLVVSSTGMVCGFILWTVMVRRRLYREVGETKLLPV